MHDGSYLLVGGLFLLCQNRLYRNLYKKKKKKGKKPIQKKLTKPKNNHNKLFPITFLPDITI